MSEKIIETTNLSKKYGAKNVLKGVDINVERGQIYGLVGRNGAGKTTLLRIISGHTFPTNGMVTLFHASTKSELETARKKTGSLIEHAGLDLGITSFQTLEYYRIQKGVTDKKCVNDTLKIVGLQDAAKEKVKNFSLGMKQRLGIAIALIGNPELLILDEPINGLDPIGVSDIRNLILKLNKEKNITIIISSHILSELSNVATHYAFLEKGCVVEEISSKDLLDKCQSYLEIIVDDAPKAVSVITKKLLYSDYKISNNEKIKIYDLKNDLKEVFSLFSSENVNIKSVNTVKSSLEDYFKNLIGGNSNV